MNEEILIGTTDKSESRRRRTLAESATNTTNAGETATAERKKGETISQVEIEDPDTKTGKMTTDEIVTEIGIETDEAVVLNDQSAAHALGKHRRQVERHENRRRHIYGTYYE